MRSFTYVMREMLQFSGLLGITRSVALLPRVMRLSPLRPTSGTPPLLVAVAFWEWVSNRRGNAVDPARGGVW